MGPLSPGVAAKDLREIANRVLLYSEKNSLEDVWQKLEQLFRQVPQVRGKRAEGSRWKACPKAGVRFRNAQTTSCRLARLQSLPQANRSQGTTGKCLDESRKDIRSSRRHFHGFLRRFAGFRKLGPILDCKLRGIRSEGITAQHIGFR
jgi:hypothetical protein